MHPVDWLFLLVPSLAVVYIAIRTHYYTKGVAGFLAGGRVAGRYVVAVSDGAASFGLISAIALWEKYYQSGFAIGFWQKLGTPIALIMTLTGFLIYRYRETRAMTMGAIFRSALLQALPHFRRHHCLRGRCDQLRPLPGGRSPFFHLLHGDAS